MYYFIFLKQMVKGLLYLLVVDLFNHVGESVCGFDNRGKISTLITIDKNI